jgi:hypothetical protein
MAEPYLHFHHMTITDEDIVGYEDTTEHFKHQPGLQDCLPVAVKNILSELAEQHEKPQIEHSESEIKEMSDFDPEMGTSGRSLVPNLSAELEPFGYTVKDQTNGTPEDLNSVITSSSSSMPVVSLKPAYFDEIANWDPRGSRRGRNRPHAIVLFKMNSEEVLFFDPYGEMQLRSGNRTQPKRRLKYRKFLDLWNTQKSWPRWALWIDRLQETTLAHFQEA